MDFFTTATLQSRKSADLLVIPFWKGSKRAEEAAEAASFGKLLADPLSTSDFKGTEGELLIHYVSGQPEKRFALLGLGAQNELTVEKLRRSYANITKICRKNKLESINIVVPKCTSMAEQDVILGLSEGLLLPNYAFSSLKHDTIKDGKPVLLEKATIIGANKTELTLANKCATLCESVNFVRDLVNGNADDVTPQHLAAVARGLEKTCKHVKTTVFDKNVSKRKG
jgi:Leucyl aminopeptidase